MMVTITMNQVLAVGAAIITINTALSIIVSWIAKAKEPQNKISERVTKLEDRVSRHDELFLKDNKRLETLEQGTTVTQRALLALLDHGIDGNAIEPMMQAKQELTEYLIKRN